MEVHSICATSLTQVFETGWTHFKLVRVRRCRVRRRIRRSKANAQVSSFAAWKDHQRATIQPDATCDTATFTNAFLASVTDGHQALTYRQSLGQSIIF